MDDKAYNLLDKSWLHRRYFNECNDSVFQGKSFKMLRLHSVCKSCSDIKSKLITIRWSSHLISTSKKLYNCQEKVGKRYWKAAICNCANISIFCDLAVQISLQFKSLCSAPSVLFPQKECRPSSSLTHRYLQLPHHAY